MKALKKFDVHISSNKVELHPLQYADIQLLRSWRNQDNIRSYYISQKIITFDEQLLWWKNYKSNKNDYMFLIQPKNSNEKIGAVGLYNIYEKEAEFGRFMIGNEQYRGQGMALEACKLILQFGFTQLCLHRIYLKVIIENIKAKRIYQQVGFKHIHTEGNVELHEVLNLSE